MPESTVVQERTVEFEEEEAAAVESQLPGGEVVREAESAVSRLRRAVLSDETIDELILNVSREGLSLTGPGGFLPEMLAAVLQRGLSAELTSLLGYAKHDPVGYHSGNSRNGFQPARRVGTEVGDIRLAVPRDRNGTFASAILPKYAHRIGGLDEMIISLYAGGMTVRDIEHHLVSTLGTQLTPGTISNITDAVTAEVKEWQSRPLEAFYPVVFLDAIVVKIRDGAHVSNRAAHIAVGVDMSGAKHVLGIWVQASEGAKFWAGVCANLANRGVKDILIVCCDGLTGLPEAIAATFPAATVQTCTVHLIRSSMRFVSYTDRKAMAALLKPIYTAPDEDTAWIALAALADSALGKKYPSTVKAWEAAWERFTPFLAFGPAVRRVIYTTNGQVILSGCQGVVDVADGLDRSPIAPAGHGYLQLSSRHGRGRFGVRCAGGGVRLAA